MKQIIQLFFASFCFIQSICCFGQVSEHYFNDTTQAGDARIYAHLNYDNSIIMSGRSFETGKYNPVLIRLDSLGNSIWNTSDGDNTVYTSTCYADRFTLAENGYLYAGIKNISGNELWKVDPDDGAILWKKPLPTNYELPRYILDYDASSLLVSYATGYNSSTYHTRFAFISKATGDTLSSHFIAEIPWSDYRYVLCFDGNKDIYYSKADSIYKVSAENPDSIIWRAKPSELVSDYHLAYYDTTAAKLYYFGKGSNIKRGRILRIDPADGSELTHFVSTPGLNQSVELADLKVRDGYMYAIWSGITTANTRYITDKYNMATDTVDWESLQSFAGSSTQSARSIDLDDAGNIYLTGYHSGGSWGYMKLDGSTGNLLYQKVISLDANLYDDDNSFGYAAYVLNNQPFFIGDLGLNNSLADLFFLKADPATGDEVFRKPLGGNYRFPSKTIAIENYPSSQTVVLKQKGTSSVVEMYDNSQNLVWQRSFARNYYLGAANLAVGPDGYIYFSAFSSYFSNSYPFYDEDTDSIYVFKLNTSGDIVSEFKFLSNDGEPVELHCDNSTVLIFYNNETTSYYRKIAFSTLSSEYTSGITHPNVISERKSCFNKSPQKALIFAIGSGGFTRLMELNKGSMTLTNLANITQRLKTINYVHEIDTNRVILCGKSSTNYESIGLYNTTTRDTVWTRLLSNAAGSQVLKCVTDIQEYYLYAIRSKASDIVISKHAVATGALKWEYTFNGSANLEDMPVDIAYDTQRNRLLVTGYETNGGNKRVVVLTLDTSGIVLNTIIRGGDFSGDNYGLCAHVLYNNTNWVGGNLNTNTYGPAGFIFETAPALDPGNCTAYFNLYPDITPLYYIAENQATGTAPLSYIWNWGDGSFDYTAYPNHSYDIAGNYSICLTVSDGDGCTNTFCNTYSFKTESPIAYVNVIDPLTVGISRSKEHSPGFQIYPNPATNRVSVESRIATGIYKVHDVTGKQLLSGSVSTAKFNLDISSLASGVYFITVSDDKSIVNGKMVKQ